MRWTERQLPDADEVFLDHVGWFVRDLDAAATTLRRLGFSVSDEALHTNAAADGTRVPAGTANRLVTPAVGYLEFLASRADTPLGRQLEAAVDRYEGLHLVAFGPDDPDRVERHLRESGFDPGPAVRLRRDIETNRGTETVGFAVVRVPPTDMPEGRVQWCRHLTPDLVWREHLVPQANGVDALTGALFAVPDLDEAAGRWARFTGKGVAIDRGLARLDLDRGSMALADVGRLAELLPGFKAPTLPYGAIVAMRATELNRARTHLTAAGVTLLRNEPDMLLVAPADALGVHLLIHGPLLADPWSSLA